MRRKNSKCSVPWFEAVDLTRDPEHGQSVGIVQCHGIAQHRQMPGTQRAGIPRRPMATELIRLRLGLSHGILVKTRTVLAFDRAGDIFIADRRDRACDFRFCGVGQFDDGQAGGRGHEAEQAKRVFQRRRALLRKAAVNGTSRFCRYRAVCGRASRQFENTAWHSSGATFETMEMQPSPPLAIKGSAVASSPDNSRNPAGSSRRKRNSRVMSPVAVLQTDELPRVGEPQQRVIGQLAHGPGWNVVQDDRQRGRDGNRPEMRLDSGLHRLVVVRHHRKHRVGASRFGALRELDRLTGRIRSGAGDDADAALRHFDGGADDAFLFRRRQRRGFAAGLADQNGADAGTDLALANPAKAARSSAPWSSNGVGMSGM